jgi:hypothetical protein
MRPASKLTTNRKQFIKISEFDCVNIHPPAMRTASTIHCLAPTHHEVCNRANSLVSTASHALKACDITCCCTRPVNAAARRCSNLCQIAHEQRVNGCDICCKSAAGNTSQGERSAPVAADGDCVAPVAAGRHGVSVDKRKKMKRCECARRMKVSNYFIGRTRFHLHRKCSGKMHRRT